MMTKTISSRVLATTLLAGAIFSPVAVLSAPGTLADSPLFLSNAVEPNILFVIDDSGSMQRGMMTPQSDGYMALGGCSYRYGQPTENAGDFMMATEASLRARGVPEPATGYGVWRAWNRDYNEIYYDPNFTYTPWAGENSVGALYANMDPAVALHDPFYPAVGSLNLTTNISYQTTYCPFNNTRFTVNNYYPARYYEWTDTDGDGNVDESDAHNLVEIVSTVTTYTGRPGRSDCAAVPSCTYAEEIQNFANWYSYYSRREFIAKAAYGQVIAGASNSRMGMATINNNASVNIRIASMNEDPRTGTKDALLDKLYRVNPGSGTPLRAALDNAGKYLGCNSNGFFSGGACPALSSSDGGECQQNFTLLMTDGFYTGSFSGVGNSDGDDSSTWDSGTGGPYGDSSSDTLADIAMRYYETDLRLGVANGLNPPPGGIDENTQQHMVTYSVAFGVDGTLSAMPADTTSPFAWPAPTTNPTRIDDLRHAAWNGRGEFLSAKNPEELVTGLQAALQSIQSRKGSAASVAFNTGSLSTNSEVYLALFNSERWDGDLLAFDLDPDTGAINVTPNWSAADELDTRSLGTNSRTLLTYDGSDGIAFQWSDLTTAQKRDFRTNPSGTQDNEATGMARHGYFRGDRACESSSLLTCDYDDGTDTFNTKNLRLRGGRLGDIVHSGPVFAGAPESNWPDTAPFPGGTGQTYTEFRLANTARPGVVYVGGNDGMLHGFSQATGEELLGYIPGTLYSDNALAGLHYLTDPAYTHRYSVDLTASIADAYIATSTTGSAAWTTVLIGGLRGGGRGLFALDVTDPTDFSEASTGPADVVLWEFDSSDDPDLGFTFSRPSIVPLEGPSGTIRWAAVVGNGYNGGGSGEAKLFILFLEGGLDGVWTSGTDYIEINTESGSTFSRNGLSTPAVIDSDGNGLADRVYAGDLRGDLWAFDLSGSTTSSWGVDYTDGSGGPVPLFEAPNNQQITTTPVIVRNPNIPTSVSNAPNTMVIFGTGQYLTAGDVTTTHTQSMYGVWDSGVDELDRSDLERQNIGTGTTSGGVAGRTLTDRDVNFTSEYGWYMDLPTSGERLITDPVIRGDLVFFNTQIPDSNPCNFGGSGFLMVAKWLNGGRPDEVAFDLDGDTQLDSLDEIGGEAAVGVAVTGIATSPVNLANKRYTSTTETTGGSSIGVTDIIDLGGPKTGRLSWEELTR